MMVRPTYESLLRAAYAASEAVDAFDLNSKSSASTETFRKLKDEEKDAAVALIDFIVAHSDKLKEKFG